MDVMELNVLPRGDVADAVGIFLGKLGEHIHLIRVEGAKRNLNSLHARRIPECVGAFGQPVIG